MSRTRATIDVITHPPKVLRPVLAPIQLFIKHTRPMMRMVMKVKEKVGKRAEIAAAKFETRRLYFVNEAVLPITGAV